jgi:aryl-phospho-beta-D-glucosidase BglC (GH1 family)
MGYHTEDITIQIKQKEIKMPLVTPTQLKSKVNKALPAVRRHVKHNPILYIIGIVIAGAGAVLALAVPIMHESTSTVPTASLATVQDVNATLSPLSMSGSDLMDVSGEPLILRGAMIESPFAYIKGYIDQKKNPLDVLNSQTFQAMHSWGMNAIRINISQWIQQADKTGQYLPRLDTAVANANQAKLYVILDFHDDKQSGSPYGDAKLHAVSLNWWKSIATHYKSNPMVLYDVINEPGYTSWPQWAHGDSSHVGELDAYAAIRSAGSNQVVIFEPGGGANGSGKGWSDFPLSLVSGMTNIMFSKHNYHSLIKSTTASLDAEWGTVLNKYPIFFGEWGLLPVQDSQCDGLTPGNADAVTNSVLAYMKSRNASWTAYAFERDYLIQDANSYKPTDFSGNWTCGTALARTKGMGLDIKNFLAKNSGGGGSAPTVTLSASPRTINSGGSSTLTWGSTNATTCKASGAWDGDKPTSGSGSTGKLTVSSTYTLTCAGSGGSAMANASVTVNDTPPPPPPPPPVTKQVIEKDIFQRKDQNGWGTATDGNKWTSDGAVPGTYIANNIGVMKSVGEGYNMLIGPSNVTDVDDTLFGWMTSLADPNKLGLLLRYQDNDNWYYAYVDGKQLYIQRRLKGTFSILTSAPFVFKANRAVVIKFKIIGHTLQAKAWPKDESEPADWKVQVNDSSFSHGQSGVRMNVTTGYGNVNFFQANKFTE